MKMSDVFEGEIFVSFIDDESWFELQRGEMDGNVYVIGDSEYTLAVSKRHMEAASHAVRHHDDLVAALQSMVDEHGIRGDDDILSDAEYQPNPAVRSAMMLLAKIQA